MFQFQRAEKTIIVVNHNASGFFFLHPLPQCVAVPCSTSRYPAVNAFSQWTSQNNIINVPSRWIRTLSKVSVLFYRDAQKHCLLIKYINALSKHESSLSHDRPREKHVTLRVVLLNVICVLRGLYHIGDPTNRGSKDNSQRQQRLVRVKAVHRTQSNVTRLSAVDQCTGSFFFLPCTPAFLAVKSLEFFFFIVQDTMKPTFFIFIFFHATLREVLWRY